MPEASRLSVIIPVYNAAPYLRECLANLSGCDEVICVDDGSTDESASILSEYPWVETSYSHRRFPGIVPKAERMLTLLRAETGDVSAYYLHAVGKFNWCVAASGCPRRELAARPLFAEALRKTRMWRTWRWLAAVPWRAKRKLKKVLFG